GELFNSLALSATGALDLNVPLAILGNLVTQSDGVTPDPISLSIADLTKPGDIQFHFPDLSTFFSNIDLNFLTIVDRLIGFANLVADGLKSDIIGSLPLIGKDLNFAGSQLEKFLTGFVQPLRDQLAAISSGNVESDVENAVRNAIIFVFHDTLGILDTSGGTD